MGDEDRLLTMSEVSARTAFSINTLCQWRHRGFGPPSIRVSNRVRYRQSALEAWLGEQEQVEAARIEHLSQVAS